MDDAGNLYGTTEYKNSGPFACGAIFELTPHKTTGIWTENVFYDLGFPFGRVIKNSAGDLFGTAMPGCDSYLSGRIFELTPDTSVGNWNEDVLYGFCSQAGCSDGQLPEAGLLMDKFGNLYGTASAGGSHGAGVVFELVKD